MAITRRQFLKRTGLATAGDAARARALRQSVRAPRVRRHDRRPLLRRALPRRRQRRPQHRRAVQRAAALRTAYDGQRGVEHQSLAAGDLAGDHHRHRPEHRRAARAPSRDSRACGQLYDAGKVAVVQGCGYPDYSLSHEESRDIWQTANPPATRRWRAPAGSAAISRASTPAARSRASASPTRVGPSSGRPAPACSPSSASRTSASPTTRLRPGRRRAEEARPRSSSSTRRPPAMRSRSGATSATPVASTLLSSESYPQAHDVYETERRRVVQQTPTTTSSRSTARDLREVAKIIYGSVPAARCRTSTRASSR